MTGLFQSEKQIRDAQFAADAATGSQGINGIMGMIGGDLGRAMSGTVDPRILLAKEFEGKDLNKPEDLMQLMSSANNLGLQSEAIKIADRIRTVTPKAREGFTLAADAKRFDAEGNLVASNIKPIEVGEKFGDVEVLGTFNVDGVEHVRIGQKGDKGGPDKNVTTLSADTYRKSKTAGSGGGTKGTPRLLDEREQDVISAQVDRYLEQTGQTFAGKNKEDFTNAIGSRALEITADPARGKPDMETAVGLAMAELSGGIDIEGGFEVGDVDVVFQTPVELVGESKSLLSEFGNKLSKEDIADLKFIEANPTHPQAREVMRAIRKDLGVDPR